MTIDIKTEQLITLAQARKSFPCGQVSPASIARWIQHGVRGGIKLDTVRIGSRRYTSLEAIDRFISEQNQDDSPTPGITPAQRQRQSAAARQALADAGV